MIFLIKATNGNGNLGTKRKIYLCNVHDRYWRIFNYEKGQQNLTKAKMHGKRQLRINN